MKRLFVFVFVLFFVAILQIFGFYLILCLEFQENGTGLTKDIFTLGNLEDLR